MTDLAIDYHNAKKSYRRLVGTPSHADDKKNVENRRGSESSRKRANTKIGKTVVGKVGDANKSLQPTFNPLVSVSQRTKPQKAAQHLPTDYKTAKLKYKASKSRSKRSSTKENKMLRPATTSTQRAASDSASTLTRASMPVPTAEAGLKMLGLLRPLDNKTYEFGLASGIEVHLIESIKLCGLRKGREKSLLDMVTTLCNHLTNREEEINRWIEHADIVSLKAAEKLEQSLRAREEIQTALCDSRSALLSISAEVSRLRNEYEKTRDGVMELLGTFPQALGDIEHRLRHNIKHHCDGVVAECKAERVEEIDELVARHDAEKQRLEAMIGSLDRSLQAESEKSASLQSQLDTATSSLKAAKEDQEKMHADLKSDAEKASKELQAANKRIRSLEELLENEKLEGKEKLKAVEAQKVKELDDIDRRVKQSFKALVERKDREIEKANQRAQAAEAAAKETEKLLSNLKEKLIPNVATAEAKVKVNGM